MKRKKKATVPGAAGNGAIAGAGARAGRVRVVWPGPASPRPAHPRTWHPVLGDLAAGRVFELPDAAAARYLASGLIALAGADGTDGGVDRDKTEAEAETRPPRKHTD